MSTGEDIASVINLPAGFFVFNAKVQLNRAADASGTTEARCVLRVEDASATPFVFDVAEASLSGTHAVLPLATAAEQGMDGGSAILNCKGAGVIAKNVTLVALQVGKITPQ